MRNYGFGKNLDNFVIYKIAYYVSEACKNGTASAKKIFSALRDFAAFLRSEYELRDLEKVRRYHMEHYARRLRMELENDEKKTSTTAGYVSALNSVFIIFKCEQNVISAKEFGIERGDRYDNENKAASDEVTKAVLDALLRWYGATGDIRYLALWHSVRLQRTAGLRFRESTQIKIAMKTFTNNIVCLVRGDGVKNVQPRTFRVRDISAFIDAQQFVIEHRHIFAKGSLIPSDLSYDAYKGFAYRVMERLNEEMGFDFGYHAFRHAYAHESYRLKWVDRVRVAVECPVEVQKFGNSWVEYVMQETGMLENEVKDMDNAIRLDVSEELGHHRKDITNTYLGGIRERKKSL
jgi:hypothetical protein